MAYEKKPGDGAIFKNTKKEPGDKRPDYDGSFTDPVTNETRRIALWIRESKDGKKFFSAKVQTDDRQDSPKQEQANAPRANSDNSDLPF